MPGGKLFTPDLKPKPIIIGAVLLLWVGWGWLIYAAAAADQVLHLREPGRGLLDHYGYQACFLSGPLVLLSTYFAISYCLRLLRDIGRYIAPGASADDLVSIVRPHIDSLLLRGRFKFMLFLFVFIGVAAAVYVFSYLGRPSSYWGNDVFNAQAYSASWLAANSYLLLIWGLVYPIGLFYVLHIAVSAQLIVEQLSRRQMLRLNFLDVDGCAGMAPFGTLNVLLMTIYGWMAIAAWALVLTHRNTYFSVVAAGFGLSILFIAHSLLGIYSVFKAVRVQRDQAVQLLNGRINDMMDGKPRSFAGAMATMHYRDRVMAVAAFPYARGALAAVNALRYGPAAWGLVKWITPLSIPV